LIISVKMNILLNALWKDMDEKDVDEDTQKLKDMDVIMFIKLDCPFCQDMIKVLEEANQIKNITVFDVNKSDGCDAMIKNLGEHHTTVPTFVSRRNKVGTIGFKNSIEKLIYDLEECAPRRSFSISNIYNIYPYTLKDIQKRFQDIRSKKTISVEDANCLYYGPQNEVFDLSENNLQLILILTLDA